MMPARAADRWPLGIGWALGFAIFYGILIALILLVAL